MLLHSLSPALLMLGMENGPVWQRVAKAFDLGKHPQEIITEDEFKKAFMHLCALKHYLQQGEILNSD